MKASVRLVLASLLCVLLAGGAVGCSSTTGTDAGSVSGGAAGSGSDAGSADPRSALVDQRCTMCHTRDRIDGAEYDAAKWTSTIERMKRNGLVISDEDATAITEFLSGAK